MKPLTRVAGFIDQAAEANEPFFVWFRHHAHARVDSTEGVERLRQIPSQLADWSFQKNEASGKEAKHEPKREYSVAWFFSLSWVVVSRTSYAVCAGLE